MSDYSVSGQDTSTAAETVLYVVNGAGTPRKIELYDCMCGSDAATTSAAIEANIRRINDENMTPGGSAVTPNPLAEGHPAALSNAVEAPTGEPTYETGSLYMIGMNLLNTVRWVATPGRHFVADDAEDTGFGLFVTTAASASNLNVTMLYAE